MSALITHTQANREFFAPTAAPRRRQWCDWIVRGVVRGKIIDGRPYVDANWFATNNCMSEPPKATPTAMELLS
ncbi:hypothetical protein [uncultured Microbulbifer sp.]|uniref:hypothetical protein n=1 Tax=uncultured Microbulbifer sp. TaxID=348147 RepID=UPI0025E5A15D|nr:hypothetical protein [uncultured Microbulbifer sp.]